MGYDRLLREPEPAEAPPRPSPEVAAERKRVMDMLTYVVNDSLTAWEVAQNPAAESLVKAFALDLVAFSQAVRRGHSVEKFARDTGREPPT
jgi:hypothetical protein